jgi:hypothetical protein
MDVNPKPEEPLTPIEKEQMFAKELDGLISHFCHEFNMTYAQITGMLQAEIYMLNKEGFDCGPDCGCDCHDE